MSERAVETPMGRRILCRRGNVSTLVMVSELGLVVVCAEAGFAKCGSERPAIVAMVDGIAACNQRRRVSELGIDVELGLRKEKSRRISPDNNSDRLPMPCLSAHNGL